MNIEQIDWKNVDLLELLRDENVYFMKVDFRKLKNSNDIVPQPWGLNFSRLNNSKFRDILPLLDSGEAAIVRVKVGD